MQNGNEMEKEPITIKGLNKLKKSELEFKKADLELKKAEQQTILDTASAYYDLLFKTKNEEFNISNVNLFERQVESDSARLQKGEITLTDLAQSESSLAGANANLIKAKTELLTSKTNLERITKERSPEFFGTNEKVILLNFWATWCPPCIKEIPALQKLKKEFGSGLEIFFISVDSNFEKVVPKFLKKNKFLTLDFFCNFFSINSS